MNSLIRIIIYSSLIYLVSSEIELLDKWYFFKSQTVPKLEGRSVPQVTCSGQFCNEVDIDIVKCEAVYFDVEYSCVTADLHNEDKLKPQFKLVCKDDVYEKDYCYVDVRLSKVTDPTESPRIPKKTEINYMLIVIAFIGSQIVFGLILAPILFYILRKKPDTPVIMDF